MSHYTFCLVACSFAALIGFADASRAQSPDAPLSARSGPKVDQPLPGLRPRPIVASRPGAEQTVQPAPMLQPTCDWLACGQYVIVGIGF
jgi:hypothetical protein